MTLTSRQISIATNLLNNPQTYKVKDLSERYKVSVRTVRNDLKKISEWINEQPGCQYNTKTGKGVWISFAGDFNRKNAIESLQSLLNEENSNSQYLSPDQRKWKILTKLVFSDKYLTGRQLTETLKVSPNTFLSDLNNAKDEVRKFNLELVSKNYYGYFLDGDEISIRALMEYILQKQLSKYAYGSNNSMDMMARITTKSELNTSLPQDLNKLINYVALVLEDELFSFEEGNSVTDLNVIKSMIIRLVIIIFENKKKKIIKIKAQSKKINSSQKQYAKIYRLVIKKFNIEPIKDEEKYFIFGVKVLEKDVEANAVVKQIITYVSKKMNLPLNNDIQLQDSLTQHLLSELNSSYQSFNDYTPFTEEVKNRFSELYMVVKQALKKYISQSPLITNDTFTTLVTLHFLVSVSDTEKVTQIKALYVCSSGLGATRLLEKVVQENIPYIVSVGFASVINYQVKIRELEPDIVISIFPLEKVDNTTIIQVNPIPNESDLSEIKARISRLKPKINLKSGVQYQTTLKKEQTINSAEKVLSLSLEAFIEVNEYFDHLIDAKYKKAFMIHVQLATERIYFNRQYNSKPSDRQINKFSKKDVDKLRKIYKKLGLDINISEIVAILRYTLLK